MSDAEVTKDDVSQIETEVTEVVEESMELGKANSPPKQSKSESEPIDTEADSQSEGQNETTFDRTAEETEEEPNDFIALEQIPTWPEYNRSKSKPKSEFNPVLNTKVSLYRGDITKLKVDAIVNAANDRLFPGGGVCGAIHEAAGEELAEECRSLNGCQKGDAKITGGYNLPAKHVIQTVGPTGQKPEVLQSCYRRCFEVLLENNLRSIAFPCIATGIYGFNNENAAKIALRQTRSFLEEYHEKIDRVIFCVFLQKDLKIYTELMPIEFPLY